MTRSTGRSRNGSTTRPTVPTGWERQRVTNACLPNRTLRTFISLSAVVVFVIVAVTRLEAARAAQTVSSKPAYGEDQARRGKAVFTKSCQTCHALQPDG